MERLRASLQQLGEFIPGLLGAAVLLVFGYFLARVVQRGTARALRRANLNEHMKTGGFPAIQPGRAQVNPARLIATLVFLWAER